MRFAALAIAALLPAGAASREAVIPRSELPGLGAEDPRRPVDGEAPPWRALGRVQTELGGRCTGTMIGPRLALTAAHCLVAPRTGRFVRPSSVHLLLGYRGGAWAARARVASFLAGPGFDPAARAPAEADWALLTLDAPIGTPDRVLGLLTDAPAGAAAMLGGYQQDRPEIVLADAGCRVVGTAASGGPPVLVHDCAGTRGSSGAPLLVRDGGGRWAVAGVAVAVTRGRALGVAVPAGVFAAAARD